MSLQSRVYGFIPTSITGCALWLDGADPAGNGVVPGTGTLATWVDKSGNGFNASSQLTAATSTQNAVNGLNSISFNGTSRYLTSVTGFNNTAYTIFVVQYTTSITGAGGSSGYQRTVHGSTGNQYVFIGTLNGNVATFSGSGSAWNDVAANSTNVYNYNSSRIVCMQVSGSVLSPYTDGSSQTTKTGTTGSFSSFYIGNDNANTQPWYGFISEIIIYNSAFGNTQRQQVEAYLAQKWGLKSSLPLGHPGLGETIYRADYTKQNAMIARPFYTAFSPRQIPGCALWLDAADSSTVTGTSPITAWTDKSGNGRTVTITSGPLYGTTTRNGLKTMYFNNNVISSSIASAVGTGDFTLIAAWYQSSAGTNTVLSLGTVASSSQSLGYSGNKYNFYQYGSLESAYNTTPTWVVQIGTRISSIKRLYITGTIGSVPASDSFNVSDTTVTIGKGDNFAITGEIAEIMVYTGTMSDISRQLLESYLAQKWGTTASLPGDHLNVTQPAGAITLTALTNFRILSRSRGSPITSTTLNTIATYLRNYMSEFRNPSFYGYNLDGNSYYINDGGGDMYDAGNWTYPWLISGTQYTNANGNSQQAFSINYSSTTATTVDTDFVYASLGYAASTGTTITSNHPLTVLGFRTSTGTPVGFQLGGNSGADGGGTLASGILYAGDIIQGFTVHAFYRETYNAGDPSHCNLFILLGHPSWISVFGTISSFADPVANGGNGCFFYTSGAGVSNILAIQTLLSKSGGVLVTAAECQTVVQAFVNRVKLAVGF